MPHGRPLSDKEWVQLAIDRSKTEDEYFNMIFGRVEWGRIFWDKKYGGKLIRFAKLKNPYRCKKFVWVEDPRVKEIHDEVRDFMDSKSVDLKKIGLNLNKILPTRRRKRCNALVGTCEHTKGIQKRGRRN